MTPNSPRVEYRQRALTAQQASDIVGRWVEPVEPNVTDQVVVHDADTGDPVLAYLNVHPVTDLRAAVLSIEDFSSVRRSSGMAGASRTFGSSPRRPIYGREGCLPSQLSAGRPDVHSVLCRWAEHLSAQLAAVAPRVVETGRSVTDSIAADWRLGDTHWTSGVINKTSVLPYHRDKSNFPTWSAMPVLRRGITGGHLHIPEYDVTVPCRDGWAVMFPGYELVHGVTPIKVTRTGGYRYSVVFYALRGIKDCFTVAQETAYAAGRRTHRERDIADRLGRGDPPQINDYRAAGSVTRGRQQQGRDPHMAQKPSGRLVVRPGAVEYDPGAR